MTWYAPAMLRTLIFLALCATALAQPLGQSLPNFDFQTLDGQNVTLSELREEASQGVVMLTFWCTTCASCRSTEDSLANLARKYGHQAKIVAIASSRRDTPKDVRAYFEKHDGLKLTVLMDPSSNAARHLELERTTTTVLLDKKGKVRYFGTFAQRDKHYAREAIRSLLEKDRVAQPLGPISG